MKLLPDPQQSRPLAIGLLAVAVKNGVVLWRVKSPPARSAPDHFLMIVSFLF